MQSWPLLTSPECLADRDSVETSIKSRAAFDSDYTPQRFFLLLLPMLFAFTCASSAHAQNQVPVDFEKDIAPLFRDRCLSCHAESPNGGLSLTTQATWLQGGDSGSAFDTIEPEKSSLWIRVTAGPDEEHRMPPEGSRLNSEQLTRLKRWLSDGAHWPEKSVLQSPLGVQGGSSSCCSVRVE